jgi:hypothetical protein
MSQEHHIKKRGEPVSCPFCGKALPRPMPMADAAGAPLELSGARCDCGALCLLDASGREGGEILLDGLSLLCGGDLDEAMALQSGIDYELQSRLYDARSHRLEGAPLRRSGYGMAKLWFLRRLATWHLPAAGGPARD